MAAFRCSVGPRTDLQVFIDTKWSGHNRIQQQISLISTGAKNEYATNSQSAQRVR